MSTMKLFELSIFILSGMNWSRNSISYAGCDIVLTDVFDVKEI